MRQKNKNLREKLQNLDREMSKNISESAKAQSEKKEHMKSSKILETSQKKQIIDLEKKLNFMTKELKRQ